MNPFIDRPDDNDHSPYSRDLNAGSLFGNNTDVYLLRCSRCQRAECGMVKGDTIAPLENAICDLTLGSARDSEPQVRQRLAIRAPPRWLRDWRIAPLSRLFEPEEHLVGFVVDTAGVRIVRVLQRVAFEIEHEAGGKHFRLHGGRIDAMQRAGVARA